MPVDLRNPVIEGYLSGLQIRKQREQQEIENALKQQESARQDAELKIREQQFQSYVKHLGFEEQHAQSLLDQRKQEVAAEAAKNKVAAQMDLYKMAAQNQIQAGPGQYQGQMAPQQTQAANEEMLPQTNVRMMPQAPQGQKLFSPGEIRLGDISLSPDQVVSAEDAQARRAAEFKQMTPLLAEREGLVAGAEAKAKDPYQRGIELLKHTYGMEENAQQGRYAFDRAKLGADAGITEAKIHANATMDAARIRQFTGLQDEKAVADTVLRFATGKSQRKLGANPGDKLIAQHLDAAGLREVPSTDIAKLNDIKALDPLENLMEDFIKELPPDKLNAAGQLITAKIPTTHLNAMQKRVVSVAGQVSKTIGGESGRLTEDDIKRSFGLLVTTGLTAQEARENLKFFVANRRNAVLNKLGNMSDKQRILLLKANDFDPIKFSPTVKYQGHTVPKYAIDPKDPDKEIRIFNPSTGTWDIQ